jgi:type I restriction enzyme S subunit
VELIKHNLAIRKIKENALVFHAISEQSRIVNKVKKLMSLCDQLEQQSLTSLDAHQQLVETLLATLTDSQNAEELAENWARISQHFDTLFTTEASIEALKQTILQLALWVNWCRKILTTNRLLNCLNVLSRKKRNW